MVRARLALDKADGEPVWVSAWGGLEECPRGAFSPARRPRRVVILVVEQGREHRHRFVLGTDVAAATEAAIREEPRRGLGSRSLRRPGQQVAPARRVAALMAVIVMAALAAIAALLLSAAHVVHF